MEDKELIRIKAMCLLHHDGKLLASKGFDRTTQKAFYRLLGGSINFFETSEDGIRREMQEELQSDIENLKLIDVVENLFTYEGVRRHDVIFLYTGTLTQKALYTQKTISITDGPHTFSAEWIPVEKIRSHEMTLYPTLDYPALFNKLGY